MGVLDGRNLVNVKLLRRLIGKLSHVSSLFPVMRPFVQPLWAALHTDGLHNAPKGMVWTKQICHSLVWLRAFLNGTQGSLCRNYNLDDHFGSGQDVLICTDASTYAMGAVLVLQGNLMAYMSERITEKESELLHVRLLDSRSQQCFEALVLLVALRLWHRHWINRRVRLTVRSDSVTALILALKLKAKSYGTGVIAREIALDLADSLYFPTLAERLPGTSNWLCDALSRPDEHEIPGMLQTITRDQPLPRTLEYFRTLRSPCKLLENKHLQHSVLQA